MNLCYVVPFYHGSAKKAKEGFIAFYIGEGKFLCFVRFYFAFFVKMAKNYLKEQIISSIFAIFLPQNVVD